MIRLIQVGQWQRMLFGVERSAPFMAVVLPTGGDRHPPWFRALFPSHSGSIALIPTRKIGSGWCDEQKFTFRAAATVAMICWLPRSIFLVHSCPCCTIVIGWRRLGAPHEQLFCLGRHHQKRANTKARTAFSIHLSTIPGTSRYTLSMWCFCSRNSTIFGVLEFMDVPISGMKICTSLRGCGGSSTLRLRTGCRCSGGLASRRVSFSFLDDFWVRPSSAVSVGTLRSFPNHIILWLTLIDYWTTNNYC